MGTWSRYNFVVTKNDLPVKAAGEPVYLTPTGKVRKGQQSLNVRDGEPVVFDPVQNITLDESGIATAERVAFAVGVDRNGDGYADELRHIAGDSVNLLGGVLSANGTGPRCAAPQVIDVAVDCLEPNETYSLSFFLDDSWIRSKYNFNESAEFVFSGVAPDLSKCDDCESITDCGDVLDQIIEQINTNAQFDPTQTGRKTYFQAQDLIDEYQPFSATRLRPYSHAFDMSWGDDTCKECTHFDGITGIVIDGGTPVTFDFTTLAGDSTKSVEGNIDRILAAIDQAFVDAEVPGKANRLDTTGKCCDFSFEINTDAASVELTKDSSGNIAPTATTTPLNDLGKTCAMRVFVDTVDVECACGRPTNKPVPNYWGRTIDIQAQSKSFSDAELIVSEVQKQVLPTGLGYLWQDLEHYKQHHGGGGGDFRKSNYYTGKIGLPDEGSRFTQASVTDCEQSYCVLTLETQTESGPRQGVFEYSHAVALSYILVPSSHTTAKASVISHLNAIKDRSRFTIADVSCE